MRRLFLLIALLTASSAYAEDEITFRYATQRIEARPGEISAIFIKVDAPAATPPVEAAGGSPPLPAVFSVSVTSGTVTPDSFELQQQGDRVIGEFKVIYKVPDNVRPGEVQISVEGGQGLRLLGALQAGSTLFRGEGRLFLTPVEGSPPAAAPPDNPQLKPTSNIVNPTVDIIKRVGGIASIIAIIAGGTWLIKRPRTKEPLEKKPRPPREYPEPFKEPEQPDEDLVLTVLLEPNHTMIEGDADPKRVVTLVTTFRWGSKRSGEIKTAQFTAGHPDYRVEDSGLDQERIEGNVKVPWAWTTVDMPFEVTVTAIPTTGKSRKPITRKASCTVRIIGADPKLVLRDPSPGVVVATGCNDVTIEGELWLFGAPARNEKLKIGPITGAINGQRWPKADYKKGGKWTPPFLLQEPGYAEVIRLTVNAEWVGGTRFPLARKPIPPLMPGECEVAVQGCSASFSVANNCKLILPAPGTELFGLASLSATDSKNGFDISTAKFRCDIRDFSQGPNDLKKGDCKIPAKLPPEIEAMAGNPALRTKESLDKIISKQKPTTTPMTLEVKKDGALYTPGFEKKAGVPESKDGIKLGTYAIEKNKEPIHNGFVISTLVLDDGFGGVLELRDQTLVQLGSLVFETGGPDFRIYEYRPHCLDIRYEHGKEEGYFYSIQHDEVRFRYEFAVVNPAGDPVASAGSVEIDARSLIESEGHLFFFGETPREYDYGYQPATGKTRRTLKETDSRDLKLADEETTAPYWQRLWHPVEESPKVLDLRRKWHALASAHAKTEEGLPWLLRDARDRPWPWTDTTLSLAVRVEMYAKKNDIEYLVATSDRMLAGVRTPPDNVWRDHRFLYVLLALRMRLVDTSGSPYKTRTYRLEIPTGTTYREATTTADGILEQLLPPGAHEGTLRVGGKAEPECTFQLKLSYLPRVNSDNPEEQIKGAQAILNNLGFHASTKASVEKTDLMKRAVQRFQAANKLEPTGELNDETKGALRVSSPSDPD